MKFTYCKLESHLEEFCWKKYSKKTPNCNKSNKSLRKKDKDLNKNSEKRKLKEKKHFAEFVVIVCLEINMTIINNSRFSSHIPFLILPMALFARKISWYYNTRVTNYLCNIRNAFISYTNFTTHQPIKDIGASIMFLGIDSIYLNIQLINQSIIPINLHNVYYVPFPIANFVSGNSLFKKNFYFYGNKCIFNRIFDDQELAYVLKVKEEDESEEGIY